MIIISLVLAYLAVGMVLARVAFCQRLGDNPRRERCSEFRCEHWGHRVGPGNYGDTHWTDRYLCARALAIATLPLWPIVLTVLAIWRFGHIIARGLFAPTKVEREMARIEREDEERKQFEARAKEYGLSADIGWIRTTEEELRDVDKNPPQYLPQVVRHDRCRCGEPHDQQPQYPCPTWWKV